MLKLEKVRHNHTIAIRLHERERFFDKSFLRALSIATILHLSAFLSCKISSAQFNETYIVIPPAVVDIDIDPSPSDTRIPSMTQIEVEKGILPRYVLEPEPPLPKQLSSSTTSCVKDINWQEKEPLSQNLFSQLEIVPYQPESIALSINKQYVPITLSLSGSLAEYNIIDDGIGKLKTPRSSQKPLTKVFVTYQVQMDHQTGRIFWHDKAEKTTTQQSDQLAETVLKKLRFASYKNERNALPWLTRGIVEITFEIEEDKTWDELLQELEEA